MERDGSERQLVRTLVDAGRTADQARAEHYNHFWMRVTGADSRLIRLYGDCDVRSEVESALSIWQEAEDRMFRREWSRPEVQVLAERVLALRADLATLADDARALGRVAIGGPLEDPAGELTFALLYLNDRPELAAAESAAGALLATPGKFGGRGEYTANTRPRPIALFGEAMVPIFRAAGIPLGGNASRDKAFAAFLDLAHDFVIGGPIPGKKALLAALRRL